jgi:hypothetical protein
MTLRRLGILQWVGLLLGAAMFAAEHVVGFGITQADCGASGGGFGIANDAWQASLMAGTGALLLAAEASAIAVLIGTRRSSYEAPPPDGRIRFLAIAAVAANAIFLVVVVLDGVASILAPACRQA